MNDKNSKVAPSKMEVMQYYVCTHSYCTYQVHHLNSYGNLYIIQGYRYY